jgi:uncharacterized FlaG/YvyC family protein
MKEMTRRMIDISAHSRADQRRRERHWQRQKNEAGRGRETEKGQRDNERFERKKEKVGDTTATLNEIIKYPPSILR